ncbi:hypothetical protein OZ664_02040 [Elizabethkingia sp. HX WHF]|uniref:Uncharacterized protein n=1 Tax=Elizabethkingia bruuniana TaxID=1756149 RepID=A0A7T7ZY57_9FLAO|nr:MULTISPECIES: hypothetical protein [Elizabethkingia]ATL42071.1 hypothetical protein CQS02_01520 [Elizabethkingia miricola]AQX85427.1 hypothetical protein AYC65_10565 [Elizabethkingia bruuniana]KGO10570.1 hypothetical protein KS04_08865 [Elizabethkingia miricola]KUY25195.1 hypothetical protein ATB97_08130 [Elizabethkingia bruuniana]MCL1638173.1 hypothetical protein [Elizabethkingia bruuniana]
MKKCARLSLFLLIMIAAVSVKGQQKYCDSLRGEIPRFCKLMEDEAIEEFPKDYTRIGKCIEVDPTIPVLLNFNMMRLKVLELQEKEDRLFTYGDWIVIIEKYKKLPEYYDVKGLMELLDHKINTADWNKIEKMIRKYVPPVYLKKLNLDEVKKKLFSPENKEKRFSDVLGRLK